MNVIIYRLPRRISFVKGRSHCPKCDKTIPFYDMIPIFSWIFIKGKCRHCKNKISLRYPLVELLVGLLAIFSFLRYEFSLYAIVVFFVSYLLVGVAFIDWDTMEIPNGFHLWLIIPCVIELIWFDNVLWYERIIGFFVISLPMFILTNIIDGAFGGGDIKLMAVCGFILGWRNILISTFIGFILGGIYAIYLLGIRKSSVKTHFAFGPFLCFGVTLSLFFANELLDIYLRLFLGVKFD